MRIMRWNEWNLREIDELLNMSLCALKNELQVTEAQ